MNASSYLLRRWVLSTVGEEVVSDEVTVSNEVVITPIRTSWKLDKTTVAMEIYRMTNGHTLLLYSWSRRSKISYKAGAKQ